MLGAARAPIFNRAVSRWIRPLDRPCQSAFSNGVVLDGLTVAGKRARMPGNDHHAKAMEMKPERRTGTANERAGGLLLT